MTESRCIDGESEPDLGTLLNTSVADFTANLGPYAILMLLFTALSLPLACVAVIGGYAFVLGSFVVIYAGGMMLTIALGAILETAAEGLGALFMCVGMAATMVGSFVVPIVGMTAMLTLINLVLAPVVAGLSRTVAAHQRGTGTLEPASLFDNLRQDIVSVLVVHALVGAIHLVGLACCGVGVLVTSYLFGFAPTLVAVHRLGPIDAIALSARRAMAFPKWHVVWTAVAMALGGASRYVPILGSAFVLGVHTRTYRALFGDGETPRA